MDKTAADILEKAADLYEADTVNWCQEAWIEPSLRDEYASTDWWNEPKVSPLGLRSARDWGDMPDDAVIKINACAMGAMALADGFTWRQNMLLSTERIISFHGSDQLREAVDALGEYLGDHGPEYQGSIPGWNDAENRTKDEVIEAMKNTAKGLRNQEVAA